MDVSKLGTGEKVAGASGLALIIFMFFSWWSAPGITGDAADFAAALGVDTSFNAWQASSFMDIIWFLAGCSGIALAVLAANQSAPSMPVAMSSVAAGLGGLATVLIAYRIIDPPYSLDRKFWVFIGLIAAAGVAYGGWTAMQEEGTSFGEQADRLGGGGGDAPPPPPPPA